VFSFGIWATSDRLNVMHRDKINLFIVKLMGSLNNSYLELKSLNLQADSAI
jgi:hypothetical protein